MKVCIVRGFNGCCKTLGINEIENSKKLTQYLNSNQDSTDDRYDRTTKKWFYIDLHYQRNNLKKSHSKRLQVSLLYSSLKSI